ncbi:hypothetical protein CYMTET_6630 [Cymbomonas tetramitiformis]|uniref:Chloride channel protein n=1 Tax=Cymbomonas tetramitiformis TaxID=36881 RepID=A0AAE0GX12_9CHLO|nr:hypothetical protein CYMTET_6630 [Cymbomonas tetramitiformis]
MAIVMKGAMVRISASSIRRTRALKTVYCGFASSGGAVNVRFSGESSRTHRCQVSRVGKKRSVTVITRATETENGNGKKSQYEPIFADKISGGQLVNMEKMEGEDDDDWLVLTDLRLLSYATIVGILSACAVYGFKETVHLLTEIPTAVDISSLQYILPALGGLVVGYIKTKPISPGLKPMFFAVDAVEDDERSRYCPKTSALLLKTGAAGITLGTGNSLGPEAPCAEIGASVGLVFSRDLLKLPKKNWLPMLASGAAAGVAAAFNAPVTGAFFAIEFALKSAVDRVNLTAILLSAATASLTVQTINSENESLASYVSLPSQVLDNPVEVAGLFGLATLTSLTAVAVVQIAAVTREAISKAGIPDRFAPVVPGILCGLLAVQWPEIGYSRDHELLIQLVEGNDIGASLAIFSTLGAKLFATAACLGGGLVGGLFAPSLFMGAMVGHLYGDALMSMNDALSMVDLPTFDHPVVYVVTGMASCMAALCRAPLTAIALLAELTQSPNLILPLLLSSGIASVLTDRIDQAIAENKSKSKPEPPVDAVPKPKKTLVVSDAVEVADMAMVRKSAPLDSVASFMSASGQEAAIVVGDDDFPLGVITRDDITAMVESKLREAARSALETGQSTSYSSHPKSDETTEYLHNILSDNFVFSALSMEARERCIAAMYSKKVKAGEITIEQFVPSSAQFQIVISGEFSVLLSDGGKPGRVVKSMVKGDSFGEVGLLIDSPKSTVQCLADGEVWVLERSHFLSILIEQMKVREN